MSSRRFWRIGPIRLAKTLIMNILVPTLGGIGERNALSSFLLMFSDGEETGISPGDKRAGKPVAFPKSGDAAKGGGSAVCDSCQLFRINK